MFNYVFKPKKKIDKLRAFKYEEVSMHLNYVGTSKHSHPTCSS
jgi:hypothetical protein